MTKIRRACACVGVPIWRNCHVRLYVVFTTVAALFCAATVVFNLMLFIRTYENMKMPPVNWQRLLPNTVTETTEEDLPNNVFTLLHPTLTTSSAELVEATITDLIEPEKTSIPNELHELVWDTSLRYTDRIVEQLQYIPERINTSKTVNILVWQKGGGEIIDPGNGQFKHDRCLVDNCFIMMEYNDTIHVDALITTDFLSVLPEMVGNRQNEDVWIYYNLESPKWYGFETPVPYFNWTATYRHDSTIVTPYAKWLPFKNSSELDYFQETDQHDQHNTASDINYASGKRKMAAALISNCGASERFKVIHVLGRYISVDVFGSCGAPCDYDCLPKIQRDYKFYLAFENANCIDYITEKFFNNALGNDIVPVVFGAPPSDYIRAAPRFSFIHFGNFQSVVHLANYLKELDKNDNLYNMYFKWKGTGSFINTKFWCRLCAMLNDLDKPQLIIPDLTKWLTHKTCKEFK